MSGLTVSIETSQGLVSLRRPTHDTMQLKAAEALPLMDQPDPLAVYESEAVKHILLSAVTDDTKATLEKVFAEGDFLDPVELWNGYCEWCNFRKVFILPLEAARLKKQREQGQELGAMYAGMVDNGLIEKTELQNLMRQAFGSETNSLQPDSTSSSEPTTAGTPAE